MLSWWLFHSCQKHEKWLIPPPLLISLPLSWLFLNHTKTPIQPTELTYVKTENPIFATWSWLEVHFRWSVQFPSLGNWFWACMRICTWPNCYFITFVAQACSSIQHPNWALWHRWDWSTSTFKSPTTDQPHLLNQFITPQNSLLQPKSDEHNSSNELNLNEPQIIKDRLITFLEQGLLSRDDDRINIKIFFSVSLLFYLFYMDTTRNSLVEIHCLYFFSYRYGHCSSNLRRPESKEFSPCICFNPQLN